jgi:hypothetical protein
MQLCFVSVHGPRETYFVDEPRTLKRRLNLYSEIHFQYYSLKRMIVIYTGSYFYGTCWFHKHCFLYQPTNQNIHMAEFNITLLFK